MKPAGYLTYDKDGYHGERGIAFDYVMAGNGLWIESEGKLMAARVPVALNKVKGLPDLEPKVALRHGKIPASLFDLALSEMLKPEVMVGDMSIAQTPFGNTMYVPSEDETYVGIVWEDGYHLRLPEQWGSPAKVQFQVMDNVVMDLHSHGRYGTWFSGQDNSDEQGLRLYTVIGNCDKQPGVKVRVGVYGYWLEISWSEVFEGELRGAAEVVAKEPEEESYEDWENEFKSRLQRGTEILKEYRRNLSQTRPSWLQRRMAKKEQEEGSSKDGIQGVNVGLGAPRRDRLGWLRWDRWFRRRGSVPATPKQ